MKAETCCILNSGGGAWAFAALAHQLSAALWMDVSETPRNYNYLLQIDDVDPSMCGELFVPYRCMQLAADKRLLAKVFASGGVPTPITHLLGSLAEAERLLVDETVTGNGASSSRPAAASGHRLLRRGMTLPMDWPLPLIVQEFIRLEQPAVYRLYGAGGQLFGWVVRRFPAGAEHRRGWPTPTASVRIG